MDHMIPASYIYADVQSACPTSHELVCVSYLPTLYYYYYNYCCKNFCCLFSSLSFSNYHCKTAFHIQMHSHICAPWHHSHTHFLSHSRTSWVVDLSTYSKQCISTLRERSGGRYQSPNMILQPEFANTAKRHPQRRHTIMHVLVVQPAQPITITNISCTTRVKQHRNQHGRDQLATYPAAAVSGPSVSPDREGEEATW